MTGVDPELALPPPVPVGSASTAGVVVMAHLRRQVGALLDADRGLDGDAPGSVHAARVAARRLRSGLKIYGDLMLGDQAERLRADLQWYALRLAGPRDLEVFASWLQATPAGTDDPEASDVDLDRAALAETLLPWIGVRRSHLVEAALVELRGPRASALRHELVRSAREPLFASRAAKRGARVLGPRVLDADARAARRFESVRADSPADLWHTVRIAAKRARYAAEVGAPALGRPATDLARLWTQVTEPLGDAQDAAVQRVLVLERVADTSAPLSAGESFACGVFVAATHDREQAARAAARISWRESRAAHAVLRKAVASA